MITSVDRREVGAAPHPVRPAAAEPGAAPPVAPAGAGRVDTEIIDGARRGDERAWACLYRELAPQVRGYFAARRLHQPDDLTSEVFLEVARRIGRFTGDATAFRTWVFVIAHSRLVDEIRRAQRRRAEAPLAEAAGAAAADDVEHEVMGRLRREELLTLLDGLTPEQRDVVLLRAFGGLSVGEVAAVLRRTTTGVKVLHHRAVKALQKRLAVSPVTNSAPDRLRD